MLDSLPRCCCGPGGRRILARMAAPLRPDRVPMTFAEFLAWDEHQPLRHEFVDGVPYAMTGGTDRHDVIALNVFDALRPGARAAGCRAYVHNRQIRTPNGRMYYPDVLVACGPFKADDLHARTPCVAVEVTSPSTRAADHGRKLRDYQTIAFLQAYVIVEQAMQRLEGYARQADETWTHTEVSGVTGLDAFAVPCGGAVLRLYDVYADTDVPPPPPGTIGQLPDADPPPPTDAAAAP